jgi:hypothetical protein
VGDLPRLSRRNRESRSCRLATIFDSIAVLACDSRRCVDYPLCGMTRPFTSMPARLEQSLNLERFGGWLAVLANVGVIAGLVLLAVEIRQNSQIVRADALANLLAGQSSAETAFMGDDTAAAMATALVSPAEMTDEEILQMWAYLNTAVISAEQTYSMYSLGLATQSDRESAAKKAADWISYPFARIWWGEMKTNFPTNLADDIDAALLDLDPGYLQKQFEGMKRGLQNIKSKQ